MGSHGLGAHAEVSGEVCGGGGAVLSEACEDGDFREGEVV